MSPNMKSEFKSPTFWLAALSFLITCGVGAYTWGVMSQEIKNGATTNVAQDAKIEKMGEKVDNGFNRLADKIDALRNELRR